MQNLPAPGQILSMGHLGHLGNILGPSWGHLGPIVGPIWSHLGLSWGHVGHSWVFLGLTSTSLPPIAVTILKKLVFRCGETLCLRDRPTVAVSRATVGSVFGAIVGYLDASYSHFGAILGHSGPILGPSWAGLGPSWLNISAKFAGANYA